MHREALKPHKHRTTAWMVPVWIDLLTQINISLPFSSWGEIRVEEKKKEDYNNDKKDHPDSTATTTTVDISAIAIVIVLYRLRL